jgi:hypothetical protein
MIHTLLSALIFVAAILALFYLVALSFIFVVFAYSFFVYYMQAFCRYIDRMEVRLRKKGFTF